MVQRACRIAVGRKVHHDAIHPSLLLMRRSISGAVLLAALSLAAPAAASAQITGTPPVEPFADADAVSDVPGAPYFLTPSAPAAPLPSMLSAMRDARRPVPGDIRSGLRSFGDGSYLRFTSGYTHRTVTPAPFGLKLRASEGRDGYSNTGMAAQSTRLFQVDSSLERVADWYAAHYGFQFEYSRHPFGANGVRDTVVVARATRSINNCLVTVVIWNPTGVPPAPKSRRGRKGTAPVAEGSVIERTSVEIQERAFRPREELVVEGPRAMVEFTWRVPYRKQIVSVSHRYQIDPYFLAAVIEQESNFNAQAMSGDSAMGLMQMIPGTAAAMGVSDPFNPTQSINGGARYLKGMLRRFNGDPERALAAYNAGPGNVIKYNGVPPFAETRNYVRRIMGRYREKAAGRLAARAQFRKT